MLRALLEAISRLSLQINNCHIRLNDALFPYVDYFKQGLSHNWRHAPGSASSRWKLKRTSCTPLKVLARASRPITRSWCWSSRPSWRLILRRLPKQEAISWQNFRHSNTSCMACRVTLRIRPSTQWASSARSTSAISSLYQKAWKIFYRNSNKV